MNINIYDMDYVYKQEYGFLAMKISSYHKQRGDNVSLINTLDLKQHYDVCYILMRDKTIQAPPLSAAMDRRSKIYGVPYLSNWEPSDLILACRPDYTLFPEGSNRFERADALQFTNNKGKFLLVTQNADNAQTNKDTLVLDQGIWSMCKEDIITILDTLKTRKNINFLEPVSLRRMLEYPIGEKFLELSLSNSRPLVWTNTMPFTDENVEKTIKFIVRFKDKFPNVQFGDISFYPLTHNGKEPLQDLLRCCRLILLNKQYGCFIKISKLKNRLDSAFMHQYELMSRWSQVENIKLSFFDFISKAPRYKLNVSMEEFYAHDEWWTDEMFRCGIDWWLTTRDMLEENWALLEWKDHYTPSTKINWSDFLDKVLWY